MSVLLSDSSQHITYKSNTKMSLYEGRIILISEILSYHKTAFTSDEQTTVISIPYCIFII